MKFSEILGLTHIKNHLQTTVDRGRIPHAQLFVGAHGSGTLPMAIAYAQYILQKTAKNQDSEVGKKREKEFQTLSHPDLHFCFPAANNKKVTSKAKATDFLTEWKTFATENPYGSLYDWYQFLDIENKQGKIGIDDAKDIAQTLSLKSFEGGYKIMIIWHAELMNIRTSNYLLKLIEEPPAKTVFILITEDEQQILQTIYSRCQKLNFPPLGENDIIQALTTQHNCSPDEAHKIAFKADGNYAKALEYLEGSETELQFENWFINWVRTAFRAKGNKASIIEILDWSETIAASGRETQKKFLNYCLNFMRQALLLNYKADTLVYLQPTTQKFKLENFAPFIHGNNILDITRELETALYHIERNGNGKIIFTDLSIKLTRLLHKKKSIKTSEQ